MGARTLAIIYGIRSLCGAYTAAYSLWRIYVRLVQNNMVAVGVGVFIGMIGLIGMVSHFRTAREYWRDWRLQR